MSLFNTLSSVFGNNASPEGGKTLIQAALEFVNNQPGGLSGLVKQFQEKGAGEIISSWVGTGANQPISPDTLQNVLGADTLSGIAQKAGMSPEQVSGLLAQVLPQVVNGATPNGQVPAGGQLDVSSVLSSLGGAGGLAALAGGLFGKKNG
jgi:uncharacterized protein YidB (DUF937 family)